MPKIVKIVKKHVPIASILPSMIFEIIQDHVKKFIEDNHIEKYHVDYGYIEENVTVAVDDDVIILIPHSQLMTVIGNIIETVILKYFKVSRETIYMKSRKQEIVKYRQIIQFFLAYYSDMSFAAIGQVTGGVDHSTISANAVSFARKIEKKQDLKKDMFIIDLEIKDRLSLSSSQIFSRNLDVLKLKRSPKAFQRRIKQDGEIVIRPQGSLE